MKLAKVLLFVMATAFLGFGLAYALWPVAMVKDVGVQLTSDAAKIDVRAVYGGMQVGIAAFLYYLLRRSEIRTGLVATLLILTGLAGTRAIGMALTGEASPTTWMLLASEAVGIPLSLIGLQASKRRPA